MFEIHAIFGSTVFQEENLFEYLKGQYNEVTNKSEHSNKKNDSWRT
jgi:hypothetical protein